MKNLSVLLLSMMLTMQVCAQTAIYTFNNTSGDATGNGNTGTLHGGATADGTLNIGNNSSDYFSIPASTLDGLNDFSIKFRFNLATIHTTGGFAGNTFLHAWGSDSDEDGLKISYDGPNHEFQVGINTIEYAIPIEPLVENQWYRAKVIRFGSKLSIFLNTDLIASIPDASISKLKAANNAVTIGQEQDCMGGCFATNQSLAGSMDHLVIYDVALPAGQKLLASDEDAMNIQLFPNPAVTELNISFSKSEGQHFSVMIFDLTGKLLMANTVTSDHLYQADVSNFPSGLYLLKVYDEQHQLMTAKKFVHQ
jgi:hypothetical protein